jgi:outer membrane murein-binding lipoprotein Lpp
MSTTTPLAARPQTAGPEPLGPLADRLAAADRILQKERGGVLLLRSVPWVAGVVIAFFVLDVVLHLPAGVRAGMTMALALLLAGIAGWCAWVAFVRRSGYEHTARVLESRHARLGSKLINILQLRVQTSDAALMPMTREMAALAVGSYARELRDEPIEQLARTDVLHRESKRAGFWLLAFAAVIAIFSDITRTEVPRFIDPFGDHPPYSFTRLEIADPGDDGTQVVYNQGLLITARSSGHRPGELFLSWFPEGQPSAMVTAPMFDKGERGFTQRIEGIKTNLVIFAHTKNHHALSKQRRVSVILTPKLEAATVKITPPAYTALPPVEQPLNFKNVKALEGSTVEFRLKSNRPLASGRVSIAGASGKVEPLALTPSAPDEVTGRFVATEPAQLKFSLTDRDGFDSLETWECALIVTHDLPPDVAISNPNSDTFVAMDFKAEPVIEASDDYGVKTVRIHTARNGTFGEPRVVDYAKPQTHAREVQPLDFKTMGLDSGDTVSIFAEAIDNAPAPHIARSRTVTFTVISVEEYNDFLRERTDMAEIEAKYGKLVKDFQELVEQQKKLGEEIDALKKQLAAAKSDAEKAALQKQLDELMAKQSALNAKLNQLADTMENFVRDQPLYDVEAELKNTLSEKAQEIRDSTAANEEAMKQLAAQQPPADQGGQKPAGPQPPSQKMLDDFKQASDAQLARLGAVEQEAQQEVMQPLEDMALLHEIVKDINRFKDLYAAQQEMARHTTGRRR